MSRSAGFEEVEHTADWAYRVWGENKVELFIEAAIALYTLADVQLASNAPVTKEFELRGIDCESLLVAWLNELLYFYESENIGFNQFEILHLDRQTLKARVTGASIQSWNKFVKAVTYHNLSIDSTENGLEATLVLDV